MLSADPEASSTQRKQLPTDLLELPLCFPFTAGPTWLLRMITDSMDALTPLLGPLFPQLLPQLCEANYYHKASIMQPQSDSVPQMDPDWHDNLLLLLLSPFLTKQNKNAHEQAQSGKILADFMPALWSQRRHWLGHYPCEGGGTKSIWRRERRGVAEGPSQVGSGVASGRPWRGTCTEWAVCGWEGASPAITAPMKQKGGWRSKNTGKELSSSSVQSCPADVTLNKSLPGSP